MKRPLFVIGISFLFATWLAFLFSVETMLMLSGAFALTGVLLLLLKNDRLQTVSVCLLCAAAAYASCAVYTQREVLTVERLAGGEAVIEGVVTEITDYRPTMYYTINGSISGVAGTHTVTVRMFSPETEIQTGDIIRCTAAIYLPAETTQAGYYKSSGIYILGKGTGELETVPDAGFSLQSSLLRLRERLRENQQRRLPAQSAEIAATMTLGAGERLEDTVSRAFLRSGTIHLFAISGLHLSVLTAFLLRLFDGIKLPKRLGSAVCIMVLLLFTLLVGMSASITRAFVMTSVMLLSHMTTRRRDSLSALGLALLLICIVRPHWVLGRGLWLSAGSTFGILVFGESLSVWLREKLSLRGGRLDKAVGYFADGAAISLSAYVATFPVLLLTNGWLSALSPIANLLILPFVPLAVIGGMLCAALPDMGIVTAAVARVTDWSIRAIYEISVQLSRPAFAVIPFDEGWMLLWLGGVAVSAGVLLYHRANRRLIAYALMLCVLSFSAGSLSAEVSARDTVECVTISRCDAAILLRGDEAVILGTPNQYEIGRLLKYLEYRGVRRIPAVFATDCGEQINSGLFRLTQRYHVEWLIGPDDLYILSQLELAFPESEVFTAGYAKTELLGGVTVTSSANTPELNISAGGQEVLKTFKEYVIIGQYIGSEIRLCNDGYIVLPDGMAPAVEPLGGVLFGETRILLRTKP